MNPSLKEIDAGAPEAKLGCTEMEAGCRETNLGAPEMECALAETELAASAKAPTRLAAAAEEEILFSKRVANGIYV